MTAAKIIQEIKRLPVGSAPEVAGEVAGAVLEFVAELISGISP